MEESMETSSDGGISKERQAHLYHLAVSGHDDLRKCSKEELNTFITCTVDANNMTLVEMIESGFNLDHTILKLITKSSPAVESSDSENPLGNEDLQPSRLAVGLNLLHAAAGQGLTDVVRFLLDMGCDVNCTTLYHQRTALHLALRSVKQPPLELIEMLLNAGADATRLEKILMCTVVHVAVLNNHTQVLPLLVAAGCPLDQVCSQGFTALYQAVSHGSIDCIRVLVKAGASADIPTPMGWTPLFLAVRSNRMDIPQLLVTGNCDVNVKGYGGTALHHAVYHANLRCVKLLLEAGANPDLASDGGHTPLTVAAYNNSKAIVEALLTHGCDVNKATSHGYMALHLAAWDGYTEIVNMLLTNGTLHDNPTRDYNTPLALACHGNKFDVIRLLLPYGCNVNNTDKDTDTPIHYVAYNGCLKSLKLLLDYNVNPDVRNKVQATPLWNAVHMKHPEVVYELVRRNVTLNVASEGINQHAQTDHVVLIYTTPRTPLFVALDRGLFDVARFLVLAGTDMTTERWFWKREFPATFEMAVRSGQAQGGLLDLVCSPLSLKHICRTNIRRQCGLKVNDIVGQFEIPCTLKDFLLLKDL